jgi:dTDP-4-dehydrorhamnose reductase
MDAMKKKSVLVLGASGMLGNAVLRSFSESDDFTVIGTTRSTSVISNLPENLHHLVITGVDVDNADSLIDTFIKYTPDVVINCIGLVKQHSAADDPLTAIPINALLPHRLAKLCQVSGAKFIHISTDCVFSGSKGMYVESDVPDAQDLYGRSKLLGEVDYPNSITLRTSIIGHELAGARSLIGWFLAQTAQVRGFRRAYFSGLPTVEIARIIRDYVIPHSELHGLYHVSAERINKFDLLALVAQTYGKPIDISADDQLVIDRSLDSARFRHATGFVPKPWPELIRSMRDFG